MADPKAKQQIPNDQMSDGEKQALKSFPPGTVWTEGKREAYNKITQIQKEITSDSFLTNLSIDSKPSDEEDKKLIEEEQKDKARLNQQAFLMFNWETYVAESMSKSDRFKSFAQVDHPEPAEINNIIFKKPVIYDILLNSKSAHLSYFIPKVRIFKQFTISANEVLDIELPIYQQYRDSDFQSIFENKEGRGGGVGLKSFKWNSIGTGLGNQFSFGAELELFFENIGEISKVRSVNNVGGNTVETSFEDLLIAKKAPGKNAQGAVYDINYYRIKAEIGWSIPPNNTEFIPPEMLSELNSSNLSLYMTLVSHEIDIADDSTVTLKIKYIAYVEALTDSPKNSNIFYPSDEGFEAKIEEKRNDIQEKSQQLKGDVDAGTPPLEGSAKKNTEKLVEAIEQEIEKEQDSNRIQVYQRILNYIYTKNMIKYTIVDEATYQKFASLISTPKFNLSTSEQVTKYNNELQAIKNNNIKTSPGGTFPAGTQYSVGNADSSNMTSTFQKSTEEWNAALAAAAEKNEGDLVIPYFHLGDLIESILEGMYNGGAGVKTFFDKVVKVILGPIIFYDYGRLTDKISLKAGSETSILPDGTSTQGKIYTGAKTVINIADIPISLDVYTAWFTKKIVDAGVANMSLRDFLNLIINDLVIRSVGVESYSFAPRQKTRIVYKTKTLRKNSGRISAPTTGATNPASYSAAINSGQTTVPSSLRFPATSLKLYNFDSSVDETSSLDNFILIYAVSDQQFELRSDYDVDIRRGIRHIIYGAETGLIKTIKFSRQDNPLIRSHNMRMASQQNSDKSVILREVYNANVEMYGNSLFEIGELIYISPTLFGSTTSLNFVKNLGIGGYFMILKIQNIIEDGNFKTSLELKWNAKGDGIPASINDGLEGGKVKTV